MMIARQSASLVGRQLKGRSSSSDPRMKQFESKFLHSFYEVFDMLFSECGDESAVYTQLDCTPLNHVM